MLNNPNYQNHVQDLMVLRVFKYIVYSYLDYERSYNVTYCT